MTEEYSISFNQSPDGIISFSGYVKTDNSDPEYFGSWADTLGQALIWTEKEFRSLGYKIASDYRKGEYV